MIHEMFSRARYHELFSRVYFQRMIHEAFHEALLFLFLLILLKVSAIHDCFYSWPCVTHVILLKALWEAKLYQTFLDLALGTQKISNHEPSRAIHEQSRLREPEGAQELLLLLLLL